MFLHYIISVGLKSAGDKINIHLMFYNRFGALDNLIPAICTSFIINAYSLNWFKSNLIEIS